MHWQRDSEGGTARLLVVNRNEPGMLAEITALIARARANIVNLRLSSREGGFHAFELDLEVKDVHHVMSILSSLRASDAVVQADRV